MPVFNLLLYARSYVRHYPDLILELFVAGMEQPHKNQQNLRPSWSQI